MELLITLLIYLVVFALVFYIVKYILGLLGTPPPMINIGIAIMLIVFLIILLAVVFGGPGYFPRYPFR